AGKKLERRRVAAADAAMTAVEELAVQPLLREAARKELVAQREHAEVEEVLVASACVEPHSAQRGGIRLRGEPERVVCKPSLPDGGDEPAGAGVERKRAVRERTRQRGELDEHRIRGRGQAVDRQHLLG